MRRVLLLLCVVAATAGCSTHAHQLRDVRAAYFSGDTATARAKIETALPKAGRDAEVLQLDLASVLLAEGRPAEAERALREVRDRFDHLEQKSLAEGALALIADDQQLAYAGEDYEKVLVRVYLALANLLGDGRDAAAYALQVTDKQGQIVQAGQSPDGTNPKRAYKQVAAGPYLHATLREATGTAYDDAARSLRLVCDWAPDFRPGRSDLERVQNGRHSAKGHGVVHVFALVGRGPYKEERAEIATQAALLIADRIVSATGKHSLPPTIAPVKVPVVLQPRNDVQSVRVSVGGQVTGHTETLTDVGRLAAEQCEALLPQVIGRAVARRVVKKAAVFGAKEALNTQTAGAELALDLAGVVWEATESADTRCWGLLPEKIQVLRLELPAGRHQLGLQAVDGVGGARGNIHTATVEVEDGRSSYVLASFPTGRLAGNVVTSRGAP